jgi:hypothetical protein
VPIVENGRWLVGMLTNRDVRFVDDYTPALRDYMTRADRLVAAPLFGLRLGMGYVEMDYRSFHIT